MQPLVYNMEGRTLNETVFVPNTLREQQQTKTHDVSALLGRSN
jgi:hypothetical protein